MKQEQIDELMNEIDRKCKLPKHWDEFIKENSKEHYLIIKDKEKKKLAQDFEHWNKQAKEKINLMKKGTLTESEVYEWILMNK